MDKQVVVTNVSNLSVDEATERQMSGVTKVYFEEKGFVVCTRCEKDPPESCVNCPHRDEGYEGSVHGIDLVARGDEQTWIAELKGAGLARDAGYQVHFHAVLGQILSRMKRRGGDIRYAIGLPAERNYLRLLKSFSSSRAISTLDIYLILLFREEDNFLIGVFDPREFSDLSWEHYVR